ncbi:MAG: hypothetical protein ACLQE9_22260 [Roseiarcus sp.]
MRKLLLFGATMLLLSLGSVGARALSAGEQVAYAGLNLQLQEAAPAAQLLAERADYGDEGGVRASVAAPGWQGGGLPGNIKTMALSTILLGFAGLVFGLSSVGVKALWVIDQSEYPVYEAMKQGRADPTGADEDCSA